MKRIKNIFYIIIISIVMTFMFTGCSKENETTSKKQDYLYGSKSIDGRLYFFDEADGSAYQVDGYEMGCWVRQSGFLVLLTIDNELVIMDEETQMTESIDVNVKAITKVSSHGVLYETQSRDKESTTKNRYLFASQEQLKMGTGKYVPAIDSINLLYEEDGKLYLIKENSQEMERIKSYSNEKVSLAAISNDGEVAIWGCKDGNQYNVYASINGDIERLGGYESSSSSIYLDVVFTPSNDFVVWERYEGKIYLYTEDCGVQIIRMKEDAYIDLKFPENLNISKESSGYSNEVESLDVFYVQQSEEFFSKVHDVYQIDKKGNKEKMLSNVASSVVNSEELIFYLDESNNLYSLEVNGREAGEKSRIATDVRRFQATPDSKQIFYTKNYDDGSGLAELYHAEIGKETEKISSDVGDYLTISDDGQSILFYKDVGPIGDTFNRIGTLYRYTVGKEVERIDYDVVASNYLWLTGLDVNSFQYRKLIDTKEDGYTYDYYYYNGENKEKVSGSFQY